MDFLLKHKITILRSLGAVMLLIGLGVHFWLKPVAGLSENEIAAANIARMEASTIGDSKRGKKSQSNLTHITKSFTKAQQQQAKYITIFAMIMGVFFLIFSFIFKEKD